MNTEIKTNTKLLFEEHIHLTNITDYGLTWDDLVSGAKVPGPEELVLTLLLKGMLKALELKEPSREWITWK